MKRISAVFTTALALALVAPATGLAQGTAFTYQGRLNDGGSPANGLYDITFSLCATNAGGSALGTSTNAAVLVSNGVFTTVVELGGIPDGKPYWLELGVRTNGGGAFLTLAPRQQIMPTPYAMFANTASNLAGSLPAAQLAGPIPAAQLSGTLPLAQLPAAVVTNNATGLTLGGTFSGDGAGVSNVDLMVANAHGAISWGTNYPGVFTLMTNQPTGGGLYPLCVAIADANGDSHPDLIVANQGGNTISCLTNNGSGSFALGTYVYPGDLSPQFVIAADMNGDGSVDVVSGNDGLSLITTLTNYLGRGQFSLYSSVTVPRTARWLAAADVNQDGKMDVISADLDSSMVMIYTNRGDGALAMAGYVSASEPIAVFAADVNQDGRPDLISCNAGNNTLSVITNGGGSFGIKTNIYAGPGLENLAVADINGDGKPDLIATLYAGVLVTFTNTGNGQFAAGWSGSTTGAGVPVSLAAADVNQDGKPDVIIAHTGTNRLAVLTNDGAGGFVFCSAPLVSPNAPGPGTNIVYLATGDLNGDGRVDIVAVNNWESTLAILFNSPVVQASFAGDGAALAGLNGASLSTGTVADARLSTNVALLNASQTFTGGNTFNNNANSFSGNGAGLANLNAGALTIGTVADSRLSANVALIAGNQTFSGLNSLTNAGNTLAGNGSKVTALNATNLSAGTIADARLSTNVALLNANQAFTGTNVFSGPVGVGTNNPSASLHVRGSVAADALRAPGAGVGTGTFAFIHRAVATNTSSHITTIYHPLTDGDPNALIFVMHNFNADSSASGYNTNLVGVWYDGAHWTLYNENTSVPMPLGRAFNVLVIKP
jgi:hypothetical protein